ncbi:MAG: TonB-dependent receptor [Porphyromonadaceae bacterium]|nr:TonB-dependent receptor [Porphyromonadaceae bacterium]
MRNHDFTPLCLLSNYLQKIKTILIFCGFLVGILFCFPASVFASEITENNSMQNALLQSANVQGVVLDENGDPLIGVSVILPGTSVGVISDVNGNFSINIPSAGNLQFSYVGYKSQTVYVQPGTVGLKVVLEPDINILDEVVAIGYGTAIRRDLTGAVSSVRSEEITLAPTVNPMEAIQGRVAGLDITKSSGQAGAGVAIQLRGRRSFTASGNPLFLIDGLPGDYSSLNPNDIESIEVLKDASSTAIYGSAGSNGVIIITTKSGKEGKMNVNFNSYVGFNGWSVLPEVQDGESYLNVRRLAKQESGTYIDDSDALGLALYEAYKEGLTIDWLEAILKPGYTQNYSLSLSEGTDKRKNYFSLNYSQEDGQYERDQYKLLSTTYKIDYKVRNWLSIGMNVQGAYRNQSRAYSKLDRVMATTPYGALFDEDGNINPFPVVGDNRQVNLLLNNNKDVYTNDNRRLNLYITPFLRINPLKGLTIETRVNGALGFNTGQSYTGYFSYQYYDQAGIGAVGADPLENKSLVTGTVSSSHGYSYKWENILTYNLNLDNHAFTLTGVTAYGHSQNINSFATADGITSNIYKWTNLGAATGSKTVSSGYSMGKSLGFIGRINYSYLGRYLLSASVRHDGDSRLAEGHKWDTFPAVNAGWRISDESFMESTRSWLDNAKIRAGYGVTGTAGISAYDSWSLLTQGNYTLAGEKITSYRYPEVVSNPLLTWEKSYNTNIGLDLSFLKNRIDVVFDYYITDTKGVIWTQPIPITNGGPDATKFFNQKVNIASTQNKGFEMTLNSRNIQTRDFKWNSTLTFSKNKEKVVSLGDGTQDFVTNGNYTLSIGSPINSFFNHKIQGVWQYGEEADAEVFGAVPGHLKIDIPDLIKLSDGEYQKTTIDENGEEVITVYNAANPYNIGDNDRQIIGHNSPDWSLGFQNTLQWKNFDFSVYMFARMGQMIKYDILTNYDPTGGKNFPKYFNYWTSTNPSNDFPALNSENELKDYKGYMALAYVDGSFFKVKNVTLGYTLPRSLLSKFQIDNLRFYGTLTNPLIIARSHLLKDYDPEMNGEIDFPLTRQLVFGVNLTF